MRAPIFSQSKICLHKMAAMYFSSSQSPVARNFARVRGVRLLLSQTRFFIKSRFKLKKSSVKYLTSPRNRS